MMKYILNHIIPPKINVELHGIPIPHESIHIEVYLYPKGTILNEQK